MPTSDATSTAAVAAIDIGVSAAVRMRMGMILLPAVRVRHGQRCIQAKVSRRDAETQRTH